MTMESRCPADSVGTTENNTLSYSTSVQCLIIIIIVEIIMMIIIIMFAFVGCMSTEILFY